MGLGTCIRAEGGKRRGGFGAAPAPLVSIVVVVFREREELRELLQSILAHTGADMEVVVVDGGSDDGSVEVLREFNHAIDYWVSEPDAGIYDAMNKGLLAARGEYALHLNAGDRLLELPLEQLRRCLREKVDVASCRVLIDGERVFIPRTGFPMRIDNWWHHQGTFYRRAAHLGYDASYRVFGDFEHNQRLMAAGGSVELLPEIVASHRNDGISMGRESRGEVFRSIRKHSGARYLPLAHARFAMNRARAAMGRWFSHSAQAPARRNGG